MALPIPSALRRVCPAARAGGLRARDWVSVDTPIQMWGRRLEAEASGQEPHPVGALGQHLIYMVVIDDN